jgi:hypothetical protein
VRGALATFPGFLRSHGITVAVSTVAAGIFGWVVNVWMLAVKFEGNNDVPVGSPVTGQNNTNWAVVFWVLCSMVVFGAVGYARAAGLRRFLYDVRTTPRVLVGLVRRDGVRARVHLLWGAGLAMLLGLLVPPAVGAVVSVGVLAALPTVIGAIAGSVLSRVGSAVLRPFRPGAAPFGMEAMIVGLSGAGAALFVAFVVPNSGIRAAVAGVCILLAIVLAQQAKAGIDAPGVTAALVAFTLGAVWVLRRVLAAKHVLADDGGFAECGLDFGTWWRQCQGAGAVRRQAVPGGVASAFGAPVGVFLGSWAGSVARLRPALFTHLAPPPPAPRLDPDSSWRTRAHAWEHGATVTIELADGSTVRCGTDAGGSIATPWVARGLHPTAAADPVADPVADPGGFDWRAPPPVDPFRGAPPAGTAEGLAARLNALADHAPSADHAAAVQRLFHDAPRQPQADLFERIEQLERQHHDVWRDRLEHVQGQQIDLATRAQQQLDALHRVAGSHAGATAPAPAVDRLTGSTGRLFEPAPSSTSIHRAVPGNPSGDVVTRLEVLQQQMRGFDDVHAPLNGHHVAVATAHHGLVAASPPGGSDATSGLAPSGGLPFSGQHGATLGALRDLLPLPAGPQVVHLPGAHAVVTASDLGAAPDLAGRGLEARHVVAAPDHVDRLAAATRTAAPDPTLAELERLQAELHRYRAVHGVPLAGPEPWYRAQVDALSSNAHQSTTLRLQTDLVSLQRDLHTMSALRARSESMDRLVEMRQTLESVVRGRMSVDDGNAVAVDRFGVGLAGLAGQVELMIAAQVAEDAATTRRDDGATRPEGDTDD